MARPAEPVGMHRKTALVNVPAGAVRLGKDKSDPLYGWDNEYGQHEAEIPAFQASRHLVSNQEFLGFVEAGAYADECYWEEEGLAWQNYTQASHPTFWSKTGTNGSYACWQKKSPCRGTGRSR